MPIRWPSVSMTCAMHASRRGSTAGSRPGRRVGRAQRRRPAQGLRQVHQRPGPDSQAAYRRTRYATPASPEERQIPWKSGHFPLAAQRESVYAVRVFRARRSACSSECMPCGPQVVPRMLLSGGVHDPLTPDTGTCTRTAAYAQASKHSIVRRSSPRSARMRPHCCTRLPYMRASGSVSCWCCHVSQLAPRSAFLLP